MYSEISLPADYNHSTNILLQIELFYIFYVEQTFVTRFCKRWSLRHTRFGAIFEQDSIDLLELFEHAFSVESFQLIKKCFVKTEIILYV
jgi:hypothetical protein